MGGNESGQRPLCVVVDDDPLVLAVTRRLLIRSGYDVISCDHPRMALREVIQREPFAIVADLHMPDIDGAELLRLVKGLCANTRRILYTGEAHLAEIARVIPLMVVDAIVTKADGNPQLPLALRALRAIQEPREGPAEARSLALGLVSAFASNGVESLDHALRLSRGAFKVGILAGLEGAALRDLEIGALLHDIGMSCLPDALLRHLGLYAAEERALMQQHPQLGADLLRGSPHLACALPVVLHHHERFDGSGYPQHLSGDAIPLAARLFAVLDTYEALTRDRPYAVTVGLREARAEIARLSGSQLDPDAVELFLGIDPADWQRPSMLPEPKAAG